MEPPWEVGEKDYINGTGHMTKMAAMLIYGKNLQKSNRPRHKVSVYRTLGPQVYNIWAYCPSWSCDPDSNKISFPLLLEVHTKFGFDWQSSLEEDV